jgi:exonuclease SbcC
MMSWKTLLISSSNTAERSGFRKGTQMKIKKLVTTNTKGINLNCDLSGRDIFTGPNGSGKSTNLEALQIGLLGYVPGRGSQLSDTFALSSSDEMSSTLEIDSGFTCTRTIKEKKTKHADGERSFSLTMGASVFPPRGEKTDNDRKARISTELGEFSIMFDLASLFSMSDNEKRKFIFGLTDPSQFGWTKERFLTEVTSESTRFASYMKNLGLIWRDDTSVQENVSNCLAWVKEQISVKRAQLKKSLAAKEQLLQQKREMGSDPGSAAELGAEYQKARKDLEQVSIDIAAAKEKLNTARMLRADIEKLNRDINAGESPSFSEHQTARLKNAITVSEVELKEALQQKIVAEASMNAAVVKKQTTEAPYYDASSKLREVAKIIDQILKSKGICPLIGKKCKADLKAYAIELGVQRDEAQREMNQQGERRNKVQEEIDNLHKQISSLDITIQNKNEEIRACQSSLQGMEKQNALAAKDKEYKESCKTGVDTKTKQLSDLQLVDVNVLEAAKNGLVNRIQTLEREIDKRKAIANLLQSFDRANIEASELEQTVDVLDDLAKFLGPVNLQGRILRDTIGPLISKVNSLLEMTGRSYNLRPIMEDKNGKEIFDFAWQKDGRDVNFESLSGGERVVFGAALACALVLQKNPPLKVLTIEAAEADAGNLVALMEALNKFGGGIDNVLIATHIVAPDVAGWQVHKLGQGV